MTDSSLNPAIEIALIMAGAIVVSDSRFLQLLAATADVVTGDSETCGMSHRILLGAQVAKELIEAGEYEDVREKWFQESERRWQESKFYKLWQEEAEAGRDPAKEFEKRGWEP